MERKKQAALVAFHAARDHAYSVPDLAVANRLLEEAAVRHMQMNRAIEEMSVKPTRTDYVAARAMRRALALATGAALPSASSGRRDPGVDILDLIMLSLPENDQAHGGKAARRAHRKA
ncbi:hypothetical protein [Roseateles chitosanitabidus]|uniref:hypothetical protein n=1 Tax=Roseateles chitosanitabidus TaxID=65048 RepID=UPI0011E06696|nr:hypothetical protein [Roseateles chitosanitabidus]